MKHNFHAATKWTMFDWASGLYFELSVSLNYGQLRGFAPFLTHYSGNLRVEALTESPVSTKTCVNRGFRGTTMAIERLPISRNALEIIISDARDLLDTLEAAGLEQAATIMASVLDQLVCDRTGLSGTSGFMFKADDSPAS